MIIKNLLRAIEHPILIYLLVKQYISLSKEVVYCVSNKKYYLLWNYLENKQYITVDNRCILLYTVIQMEEINMHMIINNSSMVPIYEQIMNQLKTAIIQGELAADTMLPSVRGLSGELKISALTVKKAYDCLEEEGYVVTVHGKGTIVSQINPDLLKETKQKEVEEEFAIAITKAYGCGMSESEIRALFEIVMEDRHD